MSEVRRGYKQTEVGVIPEDWEVARLSERAERITDGEHLTPRRASTGYYLLSARNVLDGRIDLSDVDYVGEDEYRRIRQRCNPSAGDVLISCSGTIGRVATVPRGLDCVMVRSAALVKPDRAVLSGMFLQYFLQSSAAQKQIFTSVNQGAQANLFLNHIEALRIALPPNFSEQESIAEALSDADALIESLEQLLTKKRQIKQGAMQELLTGKKRLPGFQSKPGYKQTDAGRIPEDWNAMRFSIAVQLYIDYRGRTPRKLGMSWGGGDIPALSANNVLMGRIDLEKESYFGSEELYRRWMVQGECEVSDVLITMEAPLGNIAQIPDSNKYILSQRVLLVRPKDWLSRDFLAHYMKGSSFQKQLSLNSTGSTAKGIQRKKLDALPIGIPSSLPEQTAIAAVLFDMDSAISSLETKLAKAQQLKQGMMQELLTGRIRLV